MILKLLSIFKITLLIITRERRLRRPYMPLLNMASIVATFFTNLYYANNVEKFNCNIVIARKI